MANPIRKGVLALLFLWAASAAQGVFAQNVFTDNTAANNACYTYGNANPSLLVGLIFYHFAVCITSNVGGMVVKTVTYRNPNNSNQERPGPTFSYPFNGICPMPLSNGICAYYPEQQTACAAGEWQDGNHCITGTDRDPAGQLRGGYDENGCTSEGLCPADPGWRDIDGYDYAGFDENGLDRGGRTAEQGGGYGGSAGTGGTPPPGWTPPTAPDYGSGDNRDGNGVLQCPGGYPVTVTKALVPRPVLDGLGACINECAYQPAGTHWDFDYQQEIVAFYSSGYPCSGEPQITGVAITEFIPEDTAPDPLQGFDCYKQGGIFYCKRPDLSVFCYSEVLGSTVSCGQTPDQNDQICGMANGVYQCFPRNSRCQSYAGSVQCVGPDGMIVPPTSPDHIINGGNADGNPHNDVFGSPDEVASDGRSVQARQQSQLNAQDIARAINAELLDDFERLSSGESAIPDGAATAQAEVTGLTDALQGVGQAGGLGWTENPLGEMSFLANLFPQSTSCQVFVFELLPDVGLSFEFDTCKMGVIKTLLEFIIYGTTVLALYRILITVREVR